jgi:hypothetical protein
MTYGFEDPHEQKDMWYWMSIVVTISHTHGLHHCPVREDNSEAENRLNRRLWWCIFMRNQLIAFGMRRKARVRYKEDRIPMLSLSDFECGVMPVRITSTWADCLILQDPIQRKQLAMLCVEKCKLTVCIAEMMSSQFKTRSVSIPLGTGTKSILVPKENFSGDIYKRQLDEWANNLPPVCRYDSKSSLSGCESYIMVVHKALLRMLCLIAVGAQRYPHVLPFSPSIGSTSMALGAAKTMQDISKTKLRRTTYEILQIGKDLLNLNLIHLLPPTSVTTMLATMLMQIVDMQSSPTALLTQSLQQFLECVSIMRKLCDSYPIAGPALAFFEDTARMNDFAPLQFPSSEQFSDGLASRVLNVSAMELGKQRASKTQRESEPQWNIQHPSNCDSALTEEPQRADINDFPGSTLISRESYPPVLDPGDITEYSTLDDLNFSCGDSIFEFGIADAGDEWLTKAGDMVDFG